MLGGVSGYLGSGKTTFLAMLAKASHGNMPIFSNFTIRLEGVQSIGVEDLESITHGLVLIDEAYLWLESRVSSSAINRYITKIIFQSRKRGLDIFISSQLQSAIDLRFRFLEDIAVYAVGRPTDESPFVFVITGWGKRKKLTLTYEDAQKLFPLFDTMEYPETAPNVFEPKRYNREINKFVRQIESKYKTPERMTQKLVRDFMIEKGISDLNLSDGVWARLKRKSLEA